MGCTSSSAAQASNPNEKPTTVPEQSTENVKPQNSVQEEPKKDSNVNNVVADDDNKFQTVAVAHTNQHVKTDEDAFQPIPGFVVKILSTNSAYKYDKIFINVFHHPSFNSFQNEFIFSKEQYVVLDNKQKECLAYNLLISSNFFKDMETKPGEKDKTMFKVVEFLNKQQPEMRLDSTSTRYPKISQGFLGPELPYFIIPVVHRRKSLNKMDSASNMASTASTSSNIPFNNNKNSPTNASTNVVAQQSKPTTAASSGVANPPPAQQPAVVPIKHSTVTIFQEPIPAPPVSAIEQSNNYPIEHENEDYDDEENGYTVPLTAPPKMVGWMRKRGHIVQSWKTRYFVLDNGFLTYYVDKLDVPPYGKTMKGQICLAGFRENSILLENGQVDPDKAAAYQSDRASFLTENRALQQKRRSSGLFTSEPILRIHLKYVSGLLKDDAAEDIRLTVIKNKEKEGSASNAEEVAYEFMMEASSLEEKYAWLAAIEAHTNYIESLANSGAFHQILVQDNDDNATVMTTNSPAPPVLSSSSSFIQTGPVTPNSDNSNNNNSSPKNDSPTQENDNNNTRAVSIANTSTRRVSVANTASAANQKWKIFLRREEELVMNGLTGKPNPLGVQLIRELILVKSRQPSKANPNILEDCKRLIYIDANSFELKGDVVWTKATSRYPTVKKVNELCFDIIDASNKTYRFYPKDQFSVDDWIQGINSTPPN